MTNHAKTKLQSFQDLDSWQEAKKLAIFCYRVTKKFPRAEIFGLTNQMRQCSVSISSNIAEGFSRLSKNEKRQFYHTALGSITELESQTIISREIGFLPSSEAKKFLEQITKATMLIRGMLRALNRKP